MSSAVASSVALHLTVDLASFAVGPSLTGSEARAQAQRFLGDASPRWAHVKSTATAARDARLLVGPGAFDLLLAAAWLHDIGYAPELVDTGFHPLDGARYLRRIGAPDRLCCLVANHTNAWVEAEARGLGRSLACEFPAEDSVVSDALTFADLTTGPTGSRVSVEARIAEVFERYVPDHVVHASIRQAAPELIATVRRVEARLAALQPR